MRKSDSLQAIERLHDALTAGLQYAADLQAAISATSGIPAIDALLSYAGAECTRDTIVARWNFIARLQNAIREPAGLTGRGRKARAQAAAKNLRDAAAGLQELGSNGLAQALVQLAKLVEARAHISIIEVQRLSSDEIVPGTRMLATHRPHLESAHYTNQRGAASHRAEIIRAVCSALAKDTPPSPIAALVRDVLNIPCTHADVQSKRLAAKVGPATIRAMA